MLEELDHIGGTELEEADSRRRRTCVFHHGRVGCPHSEQEAVQEAEQTAALQLPCCQAEAHLEQRAPHSAILYQGTGESSGRVTLMAPHFYTWVQSDCTGGGWFRSEQKKNPPVKL